MEYKGYLIVPSFGSNKEVKAKGRGSTHKELRGMYTSLGEARKAIDMFLDSKGVIDGEGASTS